MEADSQERVLSKPALALRLIRIQDMPTLWPQVEPLLERACDYTAGELTPRSVLEGMGMMDGVERMQMLAMCEGEQVVSIMVTCVAPHPQGLKLECLAVSGESVAEWLPHEEMMDQWARSLGCIAKRIPRARKGWLRTLPHWKKVSPDVCVMEREL